MILGPVWLMQPIPYFGETLTGTWLYEPKIDGWRMQILRRSNGDVEIWGRRLERRPNWTARLPDIAERSQCVLPKGTLVDCELSSTRGRRFVPSLFAKRPKAAPFIYVFDVLYLDDKDVCRLSLAERKHSLDHLALQKPFIPLLGNVLSNMNTHLKDAKDLGHEGIVIKRI
ncbi:MAG: hypothetical protein JSW02_04240, partial [candidate division WOR-3 bacterium]